MGDNLGDYFGGIIWESQSQLGVSVFAGVPSAGGGARESSPTWGGWGVGVGWEPWGGRRRVVSERDLVERSLVRQARGGGGPGQNYDHGLAHFRLLGPSGEAPPWAVESCAAGSSVDSTIRGR